MLAGAIAIWRLPLQLLPSIEQPQIEIFNSWRAAAPAEMEANIIEPQEALLRQVPGVLEISSNISAGFGSLQLTFEVGHDMQQAMLDVMNALNQAPPRPREANEPIVQFGGNGMRVASLFLRKLDPNADFDFTALQPMIEREIYPQLRSIAGIAEVSLASHRAKELHIQFDPYRLAAYGLTVADISNNISRASNVSGGFAQVGRREFTVRFMGQYDLAQYQQMVVAYQEHKPVYLHEVAEVSLGFAPSSSISIRNGAPAYFIGLDRAPGSNTVAILQALEPRISALNQQLRAQGVELVLSYDASVHIKRALALVQGNLLLGVLLALAILYGFLRNWRATLLMGISIPISLLLAMTVLQWLDRSLNVVSLAGLAFAVGLVLDAAIVVQENIVRALQQATAQSTQSNSAAAAMTKTALTTAEPFKAIIARACAEVSAALWASTATTVAIFVPVLFMQGVAGQLFYDLALTLAVAVSASLLVALTVLPVASLFLLGRTRHGAVQMKGVGPQLDSALHPLDNAVHLDSCVNHASSHVAKYSANHSAKYSTSFSANHSINSVTAQNPRWQSLALWLQHAFASRARAWVIVVLAVPGAAMLSYSLLPRADFLPQARIDTVFSGLTLPPGGSIPVLTQEVGALLVERLKPYYEDQQYPAIKGYNLWINREGFNNLFIYAADPDSIADLQQLLRNEILVGLPDTQTFSTQGSLFNFGFGSGREINLDLQGADMTALMAQAATLMPTVQQLLPDASVQAEPSLAMAQPELQLLPDEHRIAQSGLDRSAVAMMVRAATDGLYVGEYFDGNDRMDIILKGTPWQTPEQLAATPIFTPFAGSQTLGQLSQLNYTTGPTALLRVNGQRTISLSITPPSDMPMAQAMQVLQQHVLNPLRSALPEGMSVQLRGNADRLADVLNTMQHNFAIALFILLLLMAALFRSVLDSLLVLLSIPLSMLGGVLALRLLNVWTYQALDLLTMIGFVILLGLVVNNSILLVDACRRLQLQGLRLPDAILQAVASRARPVLMSTLTSIVGMMPLLLLPGTGTEIYRGLAAVIVGGMTFSMLFSLVLVPALLQVAPQASARLFALSSVFGARHPANRASTASTTRLELWARLRSWFNKENNDAI
jgi:multidrug efflux pump subunit AcrB